MALSPIGSPGGSLFNAVAAGLRSQLKAQSTRTALEVGGLLDPGLNKALTHIEDAGYRIAQGGVEIAKAELSGQLLDVLG